MLEATIETAGTQGALWLRSLIPVNQIYMLVALMIYSTVSLDAVLWLLPLATFYVSYAVLVVVTAQMLQSRRRLGDIRTISAMLARFADFDQQTAASMYMWNSLTPYATFFLALPLCIASLAVADSGWLPCPEFGVLSAAISFASFLALSDRYDYLALASVLIDTVSKILPALVEKLPQIPIIYSIVWYFIGPGFVIELPVHGLSLRLGLPSFAFLIVPLIFVRMAARSSWQGTYQVLVPHLVCFFWWRLTVAFLARATWFGLARAFVGSVGVIFFLPLLPFLLVGCGIYIFYNVRSFTWLLKVLTTVILVLGASLYAWWCRSGFRVGSWFSLRGKSPLSRAAAVLVIVVASCVPLAYLFVPPSNADVASDNVRFLEWESYRRYCVSADASLVSCAKFLGARVKSTGVVRQLSVSNVENPAEAFAAWLPCTVSNWLRCAYGEHYPDDCSIHADLEDYEACAFNKRQGRPCHLRELDRYTYELILDVPDRDGATQSSVRIVAADWFRGVSAHIQPGAEITFRAVLSTNKWSSGVELKLESIECVGRPCEVGEDADYEQDTGRWRSLLVLGRAVHSVWNFFLSPLVAFSS